jgi:ribonuclease III
VIARSARLGAGLDWKTSLQELTAAEELGGPEYLVDESGPDHQKSFRAVARIGGQIYGEGEGRSKKEAEQQAAELAWTAISEGLSAAARLKRADGPASAERSEGAGRAEGASGPSGIRA